MLDACGQLETIWETNPSQTPFRNASDYLENCNADFYNLLTIRYGKYLQYFHLENGVSFYRVRKVPRKNGTYSCQHHLVLGKMKAARMAVFQRRG